MKLGKYDLKYQILISGQELEELQRFTGDMAESFGLDDRIYAYKGKRPIGLFRWDLECLEEVISWAIEDSETYPDKTAPEYIAILNLHNRIKRLLEEVEQGRKDRQNPGLHFKS